jgi:ankyrin repeat protein
MAASRPGWFDNRKLDQLTTAINLGETEKALALIAPDLPLDAVAKGQHRSPLFTAIETGNVTVLEALLDAGTSLSATNDMGETPLHAAVLADHEAVIRTLIARGAAVNAQVQRKNHQYDGRTPLMSAAAGNNLPIVKILLEGGADPFLKDRSGFTALTFAEIFGKRTANYLRKIMAVEPAASALSLHDAAGAGLIDRVARLLDEGVPMDARDEMASTALHRASMSGRADVVRLLLERGVPVDARNVHGSTALVLADTLEVVQLLVAAGADPNADVGGGLTPFLCMARSAKPDVLRALIAAGANLQSRSDDGRTVLDHAKSNRPDARRLLKERLGVAADAIDLLRDEMKALVRLAAEPGFEAAAEWVGGLLNRKPAAWKRRKGVVYFHDVSIVKHLSATFGDAEDASDVERIFSLIEKLQDEVRAKGFTLVYIDSIPDENGRVPLILLPTPNKYAALLACGTNGINKGHDTEAVISWLMAMEAENPFVLTGCGYDFLDGRLARPVTNAERLAERMIAFCPDMVDQAGGAISSLSRPEQIATLAAHLASSGSFGFWWD